MSQHLDSQHLDRMGIGPKDVAVASSTGSDIGAPSSAEPTAVVSAKWEQIEQPTQLQQLYLRRLRRLVALDRICERNLDPGEPEVALTRWAIFSTYCVCRQLGVEGAARLILQQTRAAAPAS